MNRRAQAYQRAVRETAAASPCVVWHSPRSRDRIGMVFRCSGVAEAIRNSGEPRIGGDSV